MGHKNKKSIVKQMEEAYTDMLAIGESRYCGKRSGVAFGKIYSWGTYQTYLSNGGRFVLWARQNHGCKTLDQARAYVGEYLETLQDRGLSPYSVKTAAAAMGKLYGCTINDFGVDFEVRTRAGITRSRGEAVRDKGFSMEANKTLVTFAACSGLRRSELACLTGDKLRDLGGGRIGILVDRGSKGGRVRVAPLVGPAEDVALVVRTMQAAGTGKVFHRINSHADIHSFRAVYASRVYAAAVQEGKSTGGAGKRSQGHSGRSEGVYQCRKDMAGHSFDKAAMRATSEALGHSRIDVIAGHYLYNE